MWFVITLLMYRKSVDIEKKVTYAKYANVTNYKHTPNDSILNFKEN